MNLSNDNQRGYPTLLEGAVLVHVLVMFLAASWLFGGNIWWMRTFLAGWASLGIPLCFAAILQHGEIGRMARRRVWWLLPWLGFVIMVSISALNPAFRPMTAEGAPVLVHVGARWPSLPSCVEPGKALTELWFYAATYLAAFNLLLVVRRRRHLRWLLFAGVVNTLALAVVGTLQKLTGAGFYFGAADSPNVRYFGTFIYNNHWGAFLILWLGGAAGLLFRQVAHLSGRDLWHSPFSSLLVCLLFLGATAPLSASRAATGMAAVLVCLVLAHSLWHTAMARRQARQVVWPATAAILTLTTIATAAVGWLAQQSIRERYVETREVLSRNQSLFEGRKLLYADTWRLIQREPVFGWGFESYASTIHLVRPRPLEAHRQYESSYAEAHSDWLQSMAETGFVGTGLVVLMGAIPLFGSLRRRALSPLVRYALAGCGLILLYAWLEFPFANAAVLISFWVVFFALCQHARFDARVLNHAEPAKP